MGHAQRWDLGRYVTVAVVLVLHCAVLAALLLSSPTRSSAGSAPRPIELLYLPAPAPARIRPENFRPHRIGSDAATSIAPPVFGSLTMAPSTAGSNGKGVGVDWGAEARRALQAFEIRSEKGSPRASNSGSAAEDDWWPRAQHHAGEQYKTANGDWIVWINSSCYQIARAASAPTPGASLPDTLCPGVDEKPRGDLFKNLPVYQASHPDE